MTRERSLGAAPSISHSRAGFQVLCALSVSIHPRRFALTSPNWGFHWNNIRKCWQHPCGQITTGTPQDPREKYGSRLAAHA
jgi:hypothetical protein